MLRGRYAGKKAIIVDVCEPNAERPYQHVLVVGLCKAPKLVSPKMTKKTIMRRTKINVFLKYVNVNHILITRYTFSGK